MLAHAGGYGFDGPEPIVGPERNRIYSNTGIEVAAAHVAAAADMSFEEYLRLGLLEPLGMTATELRGSPAHAMWSTLDDVIRFMQEVTESDPAVDGDRARRGSSPLPLRWEVSFRAWDVSTRARGEWGSRSVGTSLRTGQER